MKNVNIITIFISVVTLIVVWQVSRGLVNYWNSEIASMQFRYATRDLRDECRDMYGDYSWTAELEGVGDGVTNRVANVFTCRVEVED